MKTKIFIDFDGTVFDTGKFKKRMYEVFEKTGLPKEMIDKTYIDECRDYLFSPEDALRRQRTWREFDLEKALENMEEMYKYVSEYLYSDTVEYLKGLDRDKYEVNLLSLGDIDFQKKKFIHSGIEQYFDNVYYCENQKWDFLSDIVLPDEKFVMIDDRSDTIQKIAAKFPNSVAIKISRFDELHDCFTSKEEYSGLEIAKLEESLQYI